jgi:mono/diheme cytochrome c family protein
VRYPSGPPAIVTGSLAMERKVQLVLALLIGTGLLMLLYGVLEPVRQASANDRQENLAIERGINQYVSLCVSCHGIDGQGAVVPGVEPQRVAPPLNRAQFQAKDPDEAKRTYDFLYKTVQRGRPGTPMPAWGQTDGGVLIHEHIHELVTLITNGDKQIHGRTAWQHVEDIADEHIAEGTLQPPVSAATIVDPNDPNALAKRVFLTAGCAACHTVEGLPGAGGQIGPPLTNIGTVATTRDPGRPPDDYIRESIQNPNAFVVPGFAPVMPPGLITNPSDLSALVEYLASQR